MGGKYGIDDKIASPNPSEGGELLPPLRGGLGRGLPSSKSISNRLLILQKTSGIPIIINNLSTAEDTVLLKKLLADISKNSLRHSELVSESPTYKGIAGQARNDELLGGLGRGYLTLNCKNCGTAYRFLTAFLACKQGEWILDGSERMRERPVKELVDALKNAGADITYLKKDGFPPLQIRGRQLTAERWKIDARQSSQYVSALAMILPLMQQNSEIEFVTDGNSLQYIDMTIKLMQSIGFNISRIENKIKYIEEKRTKIPVSFFVEYDWSAAAVWFAYAAIAKNADFVIQGLQKSELQADRIISDWVKLFGVQTEYLQDGVRVKNTGDRQNQEKIRLDCRNNPDLVPYLAALCVGLKQKAVLENVQNLAIKESNRIEVLVQELGKIAFLEYKDNALIIEPIEAEFPDTVSFSSHNDHRIAMSLALLSSCIANGCIDDMDCVKKSYPEFWREFNLYS